METLISLRRAIDYIEVELASTLEIDDIAKVALSSKYHFQRMFHALTGFTVSVYIRNRRLTLAAEDLVATDRKIIDVAFKYGYETPEAFAKAFQRMHGVTPSTAKKMNVKLKAFPRISFQIQIKGETEMNYRMVEERTSSIIIGKDMVIHIEAYTEIPQFVEGIWRNGTHDQINAAVGKPSGTLLYGYHFDYSEDGTKRYLMGAELPEGNEVPSGLTTLTIPPQTYAVFESKEQITEDVEFGLEVINVWKRIYSEWFPSSNFEQVEGPCIEKFYWVDEQQIDSVCEVWIPVKRKA